ncbi:MAG: hypothetical protein KDD25_03820 [Bdellovibrionales bacterium]|nr:hypothetical protein [Bdellovibrionales bacterium]
MERAEIVQAVNTSMSEGFEIPLENLTPQAHLFDDLKLDSLDAVDMMVHLEERLNIKVDAERFREVRHLGDVYNLITDIVTESKTSH